MCVDVPASAVNGSRDGVDWACLCNGALGYEGASDAQGRGCRDTDACRDHPCAAESAGCTDLPAPAQNTPDGRQCGPCAATHYGDGTLVAIDCSP